MRFAAASVTTGCVVALVGVSALLRTRGIEAGYWTDEGLALGIASLPPWEIPAALAQDGSPPLYFMVLSGWVALVGTGEAATHALSLLIALAAVPVAWWIGRSLFGPRAELMAALVAAVHPYLTFYAQETRMYALVVLLSMLAAAGFAGAFALGRRRWLTGFVLATAALLYTHNWGLFLVGASFGALALVWARRPAARRALARDAMVAYGALTLLYIPWVPTLLSQIEQTGAPWSTRPDLGELAVAMAIALGAVVLGAVTSRSGRGRWPWQEEAVGEGREAETTAAPGRGPALAGAGAPPADGTAPGSRRLALAVLVVLPMATLLVAWLASQFSPAWASRYVAVAVGPALLPAAVLLAPARWWGAGVVIGVGAVAMVPVTHGVLAKGNARAVAEGMRSVGMGAGDLVVAALPEHVAVLRGYLGPGMRYATTIGPERDPLIFDWRNAPGRLRAADPRAGTARAVASLAPGDELALVQPVERYEDRRAPWARLVRERSAHWQRRLDAHPRLRRVAVVPRQRGETRALVYRLAKGPMRRGR
ncbi:MAG TPA: glycosyltransferase family 39 protein [Solirubrobacteraceae bacterium]|nr:glycosyltransferase family 39 protein [Solirubrobacteraceae bacterium]